MYCEITDLSNFQVNAGPLASAKAFLQEPNVRDHPPKLVQNLKHVYR